MAINLDCESLRKSEETIVSGVPDVRVDSETLEHLKRIAKSTSRRRVRLCAHQDDDQSVQEMFIVHPRRAYIPPHKHLDKSESILIISGNCDYFTFDERGVIVERVRLGDYSSGQIFFSRQQNDAYHSLLVHSSELIFLEITRGPFRREDMVIASWAPQESSLSQVEEFHARLENWQGGSSS